MDEQFQNGIFSDFQREELSQGYIFSSLPDLQTPKLSQQQLNLDHINVVSRKPSINEPLLSDNGPITIDDEKGQQHYKPYGIRAYNPLQMIQNMPLEKQKQYMRIANNSKNFNGLQFFFSADDISSNNQKHQQNQMSFLSGINQKVFNQQNQPKIGNLNKLFSMHNSYESQKDHIKNLIYNLRTKINDSQQRCFSSIMLNKTIGTAFYQHFQNFSIASNPVNFIQDLQINLTNFINHAKRIKGPGIQLIYSIYEFWIKTFKDFVNQIWKYSQKYTLNFFKKQKTSQISSQSQSTLNNNSKKEQSMLKENKQKRKNWNPDQIRILQKIIESNVIFSQNKLKQLSEELGRSINSISSKIQKIIKSKKGEQYQQDSLLKKTIQVLKLSPEGLNKQSIIERINEYYQMGYDGQWQKSVGQLLSSRKQFNKIKGKYKLINGQKYEKNRMQQENSQKLTFRDKVIKCFLRFENYETDLKSLIQMYISMYGQQQAVGNNNQERRKSIQASISKTLSRYDIFDTSNSKTIYQYIPNVCGEGGNSNNYRGDEQSFQEYINI